MTWTQNTQSDHICQMLKAIGFELPEFERVWHRSPH